MRLDFWNKGRDRKIDLIFGWMILLTLVLVVFIIWSLNTFIQFGQFIGNVGNDENSLGMAYAFDRECEIFSDVYKCNKEAWMQIEPSEYWGYTATINGKQNLLTICQINFRNPFMSEEECIKACWRCSDTAPGSTCTTDENCTALLGNESKCVMSKYGSGSCTYKKSN